ncbi:leucine-rich repeat-containing protein 9 [Salarias fasciatus]|uniref:leucine-rich repeat-containing protein 9 n=1 Tax=Salarias fasciatus TaxID=181472 RepID=UPI001176AB35|nr:leucine-rich repeat-containing protein 9 [Salarias fasciatus]
MQSEKQKNYSDEEVIKKLCLVNGVSYDKIAQEGSNMKSLEIFFSGFPRMVGLSFFPRLCQLTIVDQNIQHIQGLECCLLLQELWIVQCHLTEISGLQNCVQLQKLYLYDNQITEMQNLELQVNLEVLWLNNNCITQIQGLHTLEKLQEVNLADNMIEKIGHSLDPLANLHHLNLSGNKISSFKELTFLARLPSLGELSLQEPTSSPNPVCLLCNYATHVLYHMPGLQRLDTYDVSSKPVKEAAESAVLKKMMYYNMRVRTARRNLAETRSSLMEKKKSLLQLPEECIKTLSHALKSLERELSMAPVSCKKDDPGAPLQLEEGSAETGDSTSDISHDPDRENKILLKIEALKERLRAWTTRMEEIEACFEQDLARATSRMEYTVEFLLMELESVGNIRLEEGSSADFWFTSCCDLLLSRFVPLDYRSHGVVDIRINTVIRIHNSALRLRFEDRLHSLVASDDSICRNHRRRLDYLFYTADPEKCEREETLCILEEGFKTAEQLKALGKDGAIPLSNSLSVTEQPRIEYALHQSSQGDPKRSVETLPFRHGQVIVSKVFVGNSTPLREAEPLDRSSYSRVFSVYRNVDTKHRTSDDRPCSTKIHECTPRRRQWFVFDHELVLPEYIVYFEYITEDKDQPSPLSSAAGSEASVDAVQDRAAVSMEPALRPLPKLLSLDDKILLAVARANVLSQITVLNLHNNSLSKIKEISRLTALRHLTVSFNMLARLDDISHMPHLEVLDASFNQLVTLEGLRGLGQLKHLDVSWNRLSRAREDTAVLRKHAPALLRLDTRHNPWIRPEEVRMTALGRLTTLTHLDGELVSEEEAAEALRTAAGSRINQSCLTAHCRTHSQRPRNLSLLSTAQLLSLSPADQSLSPDLDPDWMAKITTLNLDGQRISKLTGLSKLVNLRWASFNDNDISKAEGLDSCEKLEELSLNNNSISSLSGLSRLHGLSKLSMDGNDLSGLDASALDQLSSLSFLSVENNCIASLHGIHRLRSLLELYIGSNRISTSRDIYYLKGLTNLIILDLHGNPLVEKLENYRIYVVFHLSSLKALDGVAVEMSESESAKNTFRGRLTTDTIAEKLGHSNYSEITYLTLQSCSIRMVDLSPADVFCKLRSVNLDHNNLTSFSGLIHLPSVKALCLNYNHIESILPRQKTQAHLTSRQILHSKVHSSGYGQQSPSKASREAGPSGSLEPLMGSLEVLHLSHNGISNMANLQLSRLTNLKALFLQGNEISQVEGLEGLQQLRELVLDKNRIKVLSKSSFAAQGVLVELHLSENRIRELNHLDSLTELRKLFLGVNKLQDVAELEKLAVLPSLTELSVVGNPVARNSQHRPAVVLRLAQLQVLDGVTVTLEERTRAELPCSDQSPCPPRPGASVPTTEINLPGLLPLVPHSAAVRGPSVSAGLQSLVHGHDVLPGSADDDHYMFRYRKHKHGAVARSGQTDAGLRHSRRAGSSLPAAGLLSDGNRVTLTYSKQESYSRFPSGGKPPHM